MARPSKQAYEQEIERLHETIATEYKKIESLTDQLKTLQEEKEADKLTIAKREEECLRAWRNIGHTHWFEMLWFEVAQERLKAIKELKAMIDQFVREVTND